MRIRLLVRARRARATVAFPGSKAVHSAHAGEARACPYDPSESSWACECLRARRATLIAPAPVRAYPGARRAALRCRPGADQLGLLWTRDAERDGEPAERARCAGAIRGCAGAGHGSSASDAWSAAAARRRSRDGSRADAARRSRPALKPGERQAARARDLARQAGGAASRWPTTATRAARPAATAW